MAATKKKKVMVLHEEGGIAPTAVPIANSLPTLFVALKPGQEGESRVEKGFLVTNKEASIMAKSNTTMSEDVIKITAAFPGIKSAAKSNLQPENISPNNTCKGIKVTLDNNNMWNEFFRCKTEMIITKQGCRMFPYCRYRISGMEPSQKYSLVMEIHPVDNNCYMWTEEDWHVIGKAEHHVKNKPFTHSESPSTGQHWMQNPVSFYKLRLTNNILDQEGNVVLNAMQRYLPRLHLVKSDKIKGGMKLSGPNVTTFTFPQTEFITVPSYQNPHFTKLKIDYNPFAKGFKEDGPSSWALKLKSSLHTDSTIDLGTTPKEQVPAKKSLKSLLANHKPKSSKGVDQGPPCTDSQSTTITAESNNLKDHSLLTTSLVSSPILSSFPDKDSTVLNSLHQKQATVPARLSPLKEQAPHSPVPFNSPSCIFDTYPPSSMSFPPSPDNLKPVTTSSLPVSGSSQFVFEPISHTSLAYTSPSLAVFEQSSDPSALPSLSSGSPITDGNLGIMKWHTVLPPPETTFNSFMPTPKLESLSYSASPLLSTHCPRFSLSQPEPLSLETTFSLPPNPATSFQDDDQSLPFPEALSPLALPLPLSPSFSSLGGDPLSPTPSLSDIVHFFSISDDLEMGDDFPNTEVAPLPCPPPGIVTPSVQSQTQPQPTLVNKPRKQKKKTRNGKLEQPPAVGTSSVNLQPNLEEVEEQLFVSFTSKEALEIHLGDTAIPQRTTVQPQQPTDNAQSSQVEKIAVLEEALLRDLKHMKHRQVIHPVLQEVGLKMYLLDPALVIDLQYLGVRLPIPPPGVSLEPIPEALAPSPSVPAFVSRTGKTTDITQIKGWKDKFAPSESSSSSTTSLSKPEAAPSLDAVTKNLSAFCSDMLDEYLENEGKLIDERAASFSQTVVEPVTYELPTKSTSYVRTLDSVLKKQTLSSPTSALISEFVPPSKRPKLPAMGPKKSKRGHNRQKPGSKGKTINQTNVPTSVPNTSIPKASSLSKHPPTPEPTSILKPQTLHRSPPVSKATSVLGPLEHTAPITHSQKDNLQKKKKRLKPSERFSESSSEAQNSFLLKLSETSPVNFADMAPLESDSELGSPAETSSLPAHNPLVTKALLKQKELEDMLIWEGKQRTYITKERATVALSSLFTLAGFVCENPTAPVQIMKRRAPPCLKEFCRLGCVCASLANEKRFTHCGKIDCIFGCSCLRQKVVILKNLEGLDSSTSDESPSKKKRRKKRMTMAYSLKEVESVSQPARRARTLWKPKHGEQDPEPLCAPQQDCIPRPLERDVDVCMTCARVRAYKGRKTDRQIRPTEKEKARPKVVKLKEAEISKHKKPSPETAPPPPELPAEPSKRLEIMTGCKWRNTADRNSVLRVVCERMAQNRLNSPFWVNNYLIKPLSQSVRGDGESYCIYHKVHISQPSKQETVKKRKEEETAEGGREAGGSKEMEEMEEWQKEVEDEDDVMEEPDKPHNEDKEGVKNRENKNRAGLKYKGLPFITGISPAGILIVNKKDSSVSNQEPIKLNGKYYSLAKVQLGGMGALHPANRLAAYLTGRVGTTRQQQTNKVYTAPSASTPSKKHPLSPSKKGSTVTGQKEGTLQVVVPLAAASKTITTPTVTSCAPNDGVPDGSSVPKPSVGKDFTQFVVNQMGSIFPQQNFPSSGSLSPTASLAKGQKQVIGSAPMVVVGGMGTLGEKTRTGYQVVSVLSIGKPPPSGGVGGGSSPSSKVLCTTSGSSVSSSAVTVVSPQKIALSLQNTPPASVASKPQVLMIPVPGTSTAVPMPCAPSQPLTPLTPDQRMVLQPVPSNTGAKLFRKPSGQLIQLVPLSQLRALNPNLIINKGGSITIPTAVAPTSSCTTSTLPIPTSQISSATTKNEESGMFATKPSFEAGKEVEVLTEDSSESSDSSNISEDDVVAAMNKQLMHNFLERRRREELQKRLQQLRETLKLTCPKTPKHTILNKARSQIRELRKDWNKLKKQKVSLRKENTEYIRTISEITGDSEETIYNKVVSLACEQNIIKGQAGTESDSKVSLPAPSKSVDLLHLQKAREKSQSRNAQEGKTQEPLLDQDLMEVVNLLDDSEEETDNSSDEEHAAQDASGVNTISDDDADVVCVDIETVEQEEPTLIACAQENLNAMRGQLDSAMDKKEDRGGKSHNEARRLRWQQLQKSFKALRTELNIENPKPTMGFTLLQACKEIQDLTDQCDRREKLKTFLTLQRAAYIKTISVKSAKSEESILRKLQHICSKQKRQEERVKGVPEVTYNNAPSVQAFNALSNSAGCESAAPPRSIVGAPPVSQDALRGMDRPKTVPNILTRRKQPGAPSLPPSLHTQPIEAHLAGPAASSQIPRAQNAGLVAGPILKDVGLEKAAEKVELSKRAIDSHPIGSSFCVKLSTSPYKGSNGKGAGGEHAGDDENFTSLLNEIVFLNQQVTGGEEILPAWPDGLSSDAEKSAGTSGAGSVLAPYQLLESRVARVEMAAVVPREALQEKEVPASGDDDRSLSPLFLRLDEEPSDTTGGMKEVPPNGLAQTHKHSALTPHSPLQSQDLRGGTGLSLQPDSVSELGSSPTIFHGHNQLQNPQCNAKADALTPPPLLHMKAGVGVAKILEPNNEVVTEKEAGLAWRPMPRLVPLGLKNNPQT
ncbi:MAX dimerization protein MGA a [Aplochiton taeniatus]